MAAIIAELRGEPPRHTLIRAALRHGLREVFMVARKTAVRKKISRKDARSAARVAKQAGATKKKSAAWKKGGSNWNRVLGHFGAASKK